MIIYQKIKKITPMSVKNNWALELVCGHTVFEYQRKKPSLWTGPEALGRRRRKRCESCEKVQAYRDRVAAAMET